MTLSRPMSITEYHWRVQGECLYALAKAGVTHWTPRQRQFIADRVRDIFDCGMSGQCALLRKGGEQCTAPVVTQGFTVSNGRPMAVRSCADGHGYLELIR